MSILDELALNDPAAWTLLHDGELSNREVARRLTTDEKNVRRYRQAHNIRTRFGIPSADSLQSPYSVSSPQPKYRNGIAQWEPGTELDQDEGVVRTIPRYVGDGVDEPEDAELMRELGVDPEVWEVIARRESRWQQGEGRPYLRAYRISVRRRSRRTGDLPVDVMNEILRTDYSGRTVYNPDVDGSGVNRVFVIPVGDLQVGKIEGGGTAALIERFADMTDQARSRLTDVGGTRRLVLPWLGDCIEGVISQGGRLATRLDISVTEQVRVYRRLMLHQIATLAPFADHVIIPVVPGNHDETTRQFATSPTDSWAIEGASAVEDALELAGTYENVSFLYPEPGDPSITLDVGTPETPFVLGFTHGHLAGRVTNALGWWRDQSHGRTHIGQAHILFSGHFHHLRTEATGGGRTWIQIPALDGGSDWFKHKRGEDEPAGMVSMWVTPGEGIGWQGLTVHQ